MEPWIAEAPDAAERRKRKLLSVISAQTMHEVLVELEREHGNARRFLTFGGVEDAHSTICAIACADDARPQSAMAGMSQRA